MGVPPAEADARPEETMLRLPALIFAALAGLFLTLAAIDFSRHGSRSNPARKTWLRIGLIFAAVTIYLLFFQRRFP